MYEGDSIATPTLPETISHSERLAYKQQQLRDIVVGFSIEPLRDIELNPYSSISEFIADDPEKVLDVQIKHARQHAIIACRAYFRDTGHTPPTGFTEKEVWDFYKQVIKAEKTKLTAENAYIPEIHIFTGDELPEISLSQIEWANKYKKGYTEIKSIEESIRRRLSTINQTCRSYCERYNTLDYGDITYDYEHSEQIIGDKLRSETIRQALIESEAVDQIESQLKDHGFKDLPISVYSPHQPGRVISSSEKIAEYQRYITQKISQYANLLGTIPTHDYLTGNFLPNYSLNQLFYAKDLVDQGGYSSDMIKSLRFVQLNIEEDGSEERPATVNQTEVLNILAIKDKTIRRQKVNELREIRKIREIGTAKAYAQFIEDLSIAPDLPLAYFDKCLQIYAQKYQFDQQTMDQIKSRLELVDRKRIAIKQLVDSGQTSQSLCSSIFGVKLSGRVEMHLGAFSIEFTIHDPADYERVCCWAIKPTTPEERKLALRRRAALTDGTKYSRVHDERFNQIVTTRRWKNNPIQMQRIRVHEDQHALNALLLGKPNMQSNQHVIDTITNLSHLPVEERRAELANYLRLVRSPLLLRLRDEVLAFIRSDHIKPEYKVQLTARGLGEVYDYSFDFRVNHINNFLPLDDPEHPYVQDTFNQVFITEYDHLVDTAFSAIDVLLSKGLSRTEAIGYLQSHPIIRWRHKAEEYDTPAPKIK